LISAGTAAAPGLAEYALEGSAETVEKSHYFLLLL